MAQAPAVHSAPSETLRQKIGLVLPQLVDASERICAHSRPREVYPEYLRTAHCILRASVPLMETARDRALVLAADDPVAAALAAYLEHHIPEELGHDEWLLDDLEVVGVDRRSVLARPPAPSVAAMVGSQYYWILHYHPVALLGYIAVLEGYPPSMTMIDGLVERTGYDRTAFRTLIAHSELDPGHADELDELLDRLQLTREQVGVVGLSAITTVRLSARVFNEVADEYDEPS
jgi:Iron-containing redox enzyme